MSIRKQYLKSKPICKVTFRFSKEANGGAKHINIVGEFNKWNTDATPMKRFKNGSFSTTLYLDLNSKYQFRYLIDGMNWSNDLDADSFVYCPYGNCENSVVVT